MKMLKTAIKYMALFIIFFSFVNISSADELADIKSAIKAFNARWSAGETSISRLSHAEKKMRTGLMLPVLAPSDESSVKKTTAMTTMAETPPTSLDWNNHAGNYVTPVRDQGNCGSCWAFATAASLESATLIANLTPDINLDLAEQILVSCSPAGDCGGGYIDVASDYLLDPGLPMETCFPYSATNGFCGNACLNWQESAYRIAEWRWVATTSPTVSSIKNALYTYGPLVTTMSVYSDFYTYTGGVYSRVGGTYRGGHGVLIVGYDDPGQYFIVKNSWGTGWGESGFFRIAYSQLFNEVQFGYFTIAYTVSPDLPTLTVTEPVGSNVVWDAGTTRTIRWTYTGNPGAGVKIELYKGGALNRTITSLTSIGSNGAGAYNWTIPSNQASGDDYQILVTALSYSSVYDMSDGVFSIIGPPPPSITVAAPNGGESWTAGSTRTISWTYTGSPGTYVKILLYKGSSLNRTISSYARIGSNGSGSYNWAIPSNQASGSDYSIRVTSTSNSLYTDASNSQFTIVGPPPPSITVASPNGGESWTAGSTRTISWTYTGSPGSYVRILLYKGSSLNRTISSYARIGSNGSGSYNWAIPSNQASGSDYSIRVTSTSNSLYTDASNSQFTIVGPPPPSITVASPNGGESWTAGSTRTISWTYTGSPGSYVRILLYKGSSLNRTIASYARIGSNGNGSLQLGNPFKPGFGVGLLDQGHQHFQQLIH
jgi:C1A family cysteine protease